MDAVNFAPRCTWTVESEIGDFMEHDEGCNYFWALPLLSEPIASIVEVGSRDGMDAVNLSLRLKAPVTAFECDPRQFQVVERNLRNMAYPGSYAVELALSDADTEMTFWAADPQRYANPGTGSFYQVNFENRPHSDVDSGRGPIQQPIRVSARRFDSLGFAAPDLLVMDVQGAEIRVLAGFGHLLDKCTYVICEAERVPSYRGGNRFTDVHKFLKKNGFRILSCTIGRGHRVDRWLHYWQSNVRLALSEKTMRPWQVYQGVFDVVYVNTRLGM